MSSGLHSRAHDRGRVFALIPDDGSEHLPAGDGVLVNVPDPARFALHELIVAARRPVTETTKAHKDRIQAAQLLEVLLEDRAADVRRAAKALAGRGRGWTAPLRSSIGKLPESLAARLYAAYKM